MQAAKALTHSQRASQALASLQLTTIMFGMNAMVGCHPPQLKVPRRDAYFGAAHDKPTFPRSANRACGTEREE